MSVLVSNASPLIVLAKAGLLDLLPRLFTDIVAPQAVRMEILAGPDTDAMKQTMPGCGWLRVVELDPPLSPLAALQLGSGEAEVVEFARRQPGSTVLLDDRAGRRAAEAFGIRVLGTLGAVAIASQQGHFDSFDEAVRRLRQAGL